MAKWVTTWGNAEAPAYSGEQTYVKDITLRYNVPVMVSGSKIKLFFSNKFGTEKVVLDSVTVGKNTCANVDGTCRDDVTANIKKVTFNKKDKCKMKAGQTCYSDEIDYPVKKGDFLSVSFYIKDITLLTTATALMGIYSYGYVMEGKGTYLETFPLYVSMESSKTYALYGVDVLNDDEDASTIICYGDSISAIEWPDHFARLILKSDKNVAVCRKAISGSRVLRKYNHKANIHYGDAGIVRIDENLSQVQGAKAVVILHGINDIIHPDGSVYRPLESLPSSEEIIHAYEDKYVASARKHGLKVYFGTILPFKYYKSHNAEREAIRQGINDWIRTTDKIDGYIDFDKIVSDPSDPLAILPSFTNDHLHPTSNGAFEMAKAVFAKFFED